MRLRSVGGWSLCFLLILLGLRSHSLAQTAMTVSGTGTFTGYPVNVKSYGAVGNNVADDTAAIQAAIDATVDGGLLLFPQGTYKVSATLNIPGAKRVTFQGQGQATGGTYITGSVDGPLLEMGNSPGGSVGGVLVERMRVANTHATGVSIHLEQVQNAAIRNVTVGGYRGIIAEFNNYSILIDNVKFNGAGNIPGSIGGYFGGHAQIIASDIVGWDEGIRAAGLVNITGCRVEVNRTGFVLGQDLAGATYAYGGVATGNSFEANTTGIKVVAANHAVIQGGGVFGSTTAPGGESLFAYDIRQSTGLILQSSGASGRFAEAALRITGVHSRSTIQNILLANSFPNGKIWDIRSALSGWNLMNTNFDPRADAAVVPAAHHTLHVGGLAQRSLWEPAVAGKNLRGKNVAVGSGVSTLGVLFQLARNAGQAGFTTPTAAAGAGTLAPGTYYYTATIVTESGETGTLMEQSVVVTGPNNQVSFGLGGIPTPPSKWRLYRGTATGVYDGYYETAIGASSFLDTGAAFTGKKGPPGTGVDGDTSMQEPDANYAVIVTPAWNTSVWVTNKATTGFTINFGTAPGANSTLDWFIVR